MDKLQYLILISLLFPILLLPTQAEDITVRQLSANKKLGEIAQAAYDWAGQAIEDGNVSGLRQLLNDSPNLARASIHDKEHDATRSLLHVATDWPSHFPNISETISLLTTAGSDVNAGIKGADTETPLHWAASSNDVAAIDALMDGSASIDAIGAVIAGGDPLEDTIGFQS